MPHLALFLFLLLSRAELVSLNPAAGRWLEVTPAAPGSPARLLSVATGADSVNVPDLIPGAAMVCVGGADLATLCRRVILPADAAVPLAGPVPGVRVTGRILVGKSPASGTWFGIIPQDLELRRFFVLPLERKGERLTRKIYCDLNGRFTIPPLAPGEYHLEIHSPGGRIDQSASFRVPRPEELRAQRQKVLDLRDTILDDGVRVEVDVADSAGQAIRQAGVGAGQERPGGESIFFETHTGAEGRATLTRIDPSLPLHLTCTAPGYVRREQHFDNVPGLVRCALERLSAIEGRVIDTNDEPVQGATVTLRPDTGTVQAPRGSFTFQGLQPGDYLLSASAPGFRAVTRQVPVAAEETKALDPIVLEPAEDLAGKVVDGTTGEPVAGAAVRVTEPPGAGQATSDEEGSFTLKVRSERSLLLEVEAGRYPVTPVKVSPEMQESDQPVRIELFPGGRIAVEIWDEEADSPCAGCDVYIQGPGARTSSLTTDAEGKLLTPLLAAGIYSVSPVQARSLGSVITVKGGYDQRSVVVEPNKTAAVRFGERRQRIQVAFSPSAPAGLRLQAGGSDSVRISEASADGTFLVRRPPGESTTLSLLPPVPGMSIRQAVLPADFSAPSITLPLYDTVVSGELLRGEAPAATETLLLVSAADGMTVAKAGTDDKGSFSIPWVPPGPYFLVAGGKPLQPFEVPHQGVVSLGSVSLPGR